MKSLRKQLEEAGYSLTTLSKAWSLHRATVTRIVDGHFKKDTDLIYRFLFLRAANVHDEETEREYLSRYPSSNISANWNRKLVEDRLHSLRKGVLSVLTGIGFESPVAGQVFALGKQIDQLSVSLGIAIDPDIPAPSVDVFSPTSVQREKT